MLSVRSLWRSTTRPQFSSGTLPLHRGYSLRAFGSQALKTCSEFRAFQKNSKCSPISKLFRRNSRQVLVLERRSTGPKERQGAVDPSSLAVSDKPRKEFAALEPTVDARTRLIKTRQDVHLRNGRARPSRDCFLKAVDLRSLAEKDTEVAVIEQQYAKQELAIAEQKVMVHLSTILRIRNRCTHWMSRDL